jgi:hypothetical protein
MDKEMNKNYYETMKKDGNLYLLLNIIHLFFYSIYLMIYDVVDDNIIKPTHKLIIKHIYNIPDVLMKAVNKPMDKYLFDKSE